MNNIIEKPNYVKIMKKMPWYPGKKSNEMFEKLNFESHSLYWKKQVIVIIFLIVMIFIIS